MRSDSGNQRTVILGIFTIVILIYIVRLFYIQVIDNSYVASANNNVLRYVTQYPARGFVLDRKGKMMVFNQQVYDLMVTPRMVKSIDTTDFCNILQISKDDFIRKMNKARQYSRYKASIFEKQLSAVTNAMLQEKMYKFNGFYTEARSIRMYPQATAAHLLGYIGEVDDKLVEKYPYYKSGDYIGISGIEQSYEEALRGKRGLKVVMVDVHNNVKGSFQNGQYDSTAIAGENLVLSIDADLQAYAEKLMAHKRGGIVAIDPSNGEILTMVSAPAYDPNLLVGRVRAHNYGVLLFDKEKPLFNRAMMAYYPPGSTFKLINALCGLDAGVITSETRFGCRGGFGIGSVYVHCHPHAGPVEVRTAVAVSCNSFYCQTYQAFLGNANYGNTEKAYNEWRNYVLSFGIGRKLHVDLPHELKGNVPTSAYFDKLYGRNHWKFSNVISLSIGQGELGITPLQMANTTAIIANGGYYYIPHVVHAIGNRKYLPKEFTTRQYCKVAPEHFFAVQDGMQKTMEAGTARGSAVKGIVMCGKTGTAQNPHGKNHSVFVCYAPRDKPKIAVAVLVENAGQGAWFAAPIATLMIEKYLTDSICQASKAKEKKMLDAIIVPLAKDTATNIDD
ncbi:MAG: penicillin-binding protein 2 [Bacteroidia bacterium]|nr:penicillin-binding protein 2 [Bacteroidia bacterium]